MTTFEVSISNSAIRSIVVDMLELKLFGKLFVSSVVVRSSSVNLVTLEDSDAFGWTSGRNMCATSLCVPT